MLPVHLLDIVLTPPLSPCLEHDLEKWIRAVDPTPNQGFGVWLLRGLKKQWIHLTTSQFMILRKKRSKMIIENVTFFNPFQVQNHVQ